MSLGATHQTMQVSVIRQTATEPRGATWSCSSSSAFASQVQEQGIKMMARSQSAPEFVIEQRQELSKQKEMPSTDNKPISTCYNNEWVAPVTASCNYEDDATTTAPSCFSAAPSSSSNSSCWEQQQQPAPTSFPRQQLVPYYIIRINDQLCLKYLVILITVSKIFILLLKFV